jgi:prophage regulatory protein
MGQPQQDVLQLVFTVNAVSGKPDFKLHFIPQHTRCTAGCFGVSDLEIKPSRMVRPPQARAFLGNISNTTLWRWIKERPDFPRPIKLGEKVTVFKLDELIQWRDAQSEVTR